MLGALLGDFVKPHSALAFSAEVEREIVIHRKVDAFTDSHPLVLHAKTLFPGPSRRFAGILLDVFYDHLLAANWAQYAEVPMAPFIDQFYMTLQRNIDILPPRLAQAAPYMIRQDWLGSYVQYAGVEIAIRRMSTRLSKNGDLMCAGLDDLAANYEALASGFHAFFPQLIAFTNQTRAQSGG
ncbi:ACP phosphodiesterase [Massilia sp. CF038]|uniref:acyl carrier protein phosphodiesterase n=1 Tax=Massilia sp. CF038 TaxID=1881045 RepID=UPI001C4A67E7|nr:ACP phosphodiesterase [Massilia sp. CF038]